VHEAAAEEVFVRDCLINLGTCVAMVNQAKPGAAAFEYEMTSGVFSSEEKTPDVFGGETRRGSLAAGEMRLEPLGVGETARLTATPARGIDLGQGRGRTLEATVHGGVVGIIFDARGRPLVVPERNRAEAVKSWADALSAYPR
jgi:hypothetical protein